jgi:hypothetical protein
LEHCAVLLKLYFHSGTENKEAMAMKEYKENNEEKARTKE